MRVKVTFVWKNEVVETGPDQSREVLIEVDSTKEANRWANMAIAAGLMNKRGPISYTVDVLSTESADNNPTEE